MLDKQLNKRIEYYNKNMTRDDYTTLKIPSGIIKNIDKIVNDKKYGYSSRAEFVKEAVRKHIYFINSQKLIKENSKD